MRIYLLQVEDSVEYEASWVVTVSATNDETVALEWEKSGFGTYQTVDLHQPIKKDDLALPRPRGYKKLLEQINEILAAHRK